MDKIKIGIIVVAIIFAIIAIICALEIYNRGLINSEPTTYIEQFEQNLNPNDANLPAPPLTKNNKNANKTPNALDVMAPRYKKAQERLNNLEDLRNKEIETQTQEIKNIK